MAGRQQAKSWNGEPLVMLIRGPRHGWVYRLSDADPDKRGWLSSFDNYAPLHRRGDRSGPVVMSTIGEELKHVRRTDPDQAAVPVQLWVYTEPEE